MAASRPPSATAQLKKFSVTMRMIASLSHARESLLQALANINAVERFLYESLDIRPDDIPAPPSTKPAPKQAEAPTRFNPAWDAAAFEKHVLSTYAGSPENERANVRALVEKAIGQLITNEQAQAILAKLK